MLHQHPQQQQLQPQQQRMPLRLTAAKSRLGHSEPVSGTLGVAHAAAMLAQNTSSAVMHLRSLNPMLASLMQSHVAAGRAAPYSARQDAPGLLDSAASAGWQASSGISAFAFQGTNAHAVLVRTASLPSSDSDLQLQRSLQRRRFWFAAPPHVFASRLVATRSAAVQLQAALEGPALAYLWDHTVQSRPLLPGAAMFEAAHAAAARLLVDASSSSAVPAAASALSGVSIPAPVVLPAIGSPATAVVVLTTAVEPATGRVAISSRASAARAAATHLAGRVARLPLATSATSNQQEHGSAPKRCLSFIFHCCVAGASRLLPPSATACVQQSLRYQADQYHVHPAIIDNATQVRGGGFTCKLACNRHCWAAIQHSS